MHDENEDIIREFLIEAHESVDKLDRELLQLEKDPHNAKILNSIFRVIHTIKGTCGFLGFGKLEAITHVGESLLDSLRSEKLEMSDDIATALLELCDATRSILNAIETSRDEGPEAYTELAQRLQQLNQRPKTDVKQEASAEEPVAKIEKKKKTRPRKVHPQLKMILIWGQKKIVPVLFPLLLIYHLVQT